MTKQYPDANELAGCAGGPKPWHPTTFFEQGFLAFRAKVWGSLAALALEADGYTKSEAVYYLWDKHKKERST